jgi:hypothetical protein
MILLVLMYYEVLGWRGGSGGVRLAKDMVVMIGRPVDWRRSGMGVLALAGRLYASAPE